VLLPTFTPKCTSHAHFSEIRLVYHPLLPDSALLSSVLTAAVTRALPSSRVRTARVKPRPHQQQCRSNVRLCCQKRQQCRTSFALKFRPFDKVERCFDNVAQNGNIVDATGNKVTCCFDIVASLHRALRQSMAVASMFSMLIFKTIRRVRTRSIAGLLAP